MEKLINSLKEKQVLKSSAIESALRYVDRADFVPEEGKFFAYNDVPLPIGGGQTISQPYTVVFMLELLQMKEGQIVMDVGYGSGWQTAMLSHMVGKNGKIFAFEIVKELCDFGENNLKKYQKLIGNVTFLCKSAERGVPDMEKESVDKIIVAARLKRVPEVWRKQLKIEGIMVYPMRESIFKEVKKEDNLFEKQEFPGFVFVPFVYE